MKAFPPRIESPAQRRAARGGAAPVGGLEKLWPWRVLAACCVLGWFACGAWGQDREVEYKIKAAYLYNFTKYVEWPATAASDPVPGAPFVIGVVGASPIAEHLRMIAKLKMVGDRPLKVRQFDDSSKLQYCAIVFVSEQAPPEEQKKVLEALASLPVLTVGESTEFNDWGGVLRFKIVGDRVNLAISKSAYERIGLALSSKLLQLDVVEIVK
jgi:hypothetical protein